VNACEAARGWKTPRRRLNPADKPEKVLRLARHRKTRRHNRETTMPDLGPAALILIGFVSAIGGLVGLYGATGFAGRAPFHGARR
jgi:hypothetical protein